MDKPLLELKTNVPVVAEFLFDKGKSGEGQYGAWYLYGLKVDGTEYNFFSPFPDKYPDFKAELDKFKKGDKVTIEKYEEDGVKYPQYRIEPLNSGYATKDEDVPKSAVSTPSSASEPNWDAINASKQYDIWWAMAVKMSVGVPKESYEIMNVLANRLPQVINMLGSVKSKPELEAMWYKYNTVWKDILTEAEFKQVNTQATSISESFTEDDERLPF